MLVSGLQKISAALPFDLPSAFSMPISNSPNTEFSSPSFLNHQFVTLKNQALRFAACSSLLLTNQAYSQELSTDQDPAWAKVGEFLLYGLQGVENHPFIVAGLTLAAGTLGHQFWQTFKATKTDEKPTPDSKPNQTFEFDHDVNETFTPTSTEERKQFGFQLDGYRVLKKLGEGGMGIVYLIEEKESGKKYVFKKIKDQYADKHTFRSYFKREIKAYLEFGDSEYVVNFKAVTNEPLGVILEYMPDGDIQNWAQDFWQEDKEVPIRDILQIFLDSARGLHTIHGVKMYHRDIKPDNLFLRFDETIQMMRTKVGDFGLVKLQDSRRTKDLTGTPRYMAPERIDLTIEPGSDIRSDIFALGVTIYELLTGGQHPFAESEYASPADMRRAILYNDVCDPHSYRDDITEHLERILQRCMAKKSEDRFQTPMELIRAIKLCTREYCEEDDEDTFIL